MARQRMNQVDTIRTVKRRERRAPSQPVSECARPPTIHHSRFTVHQSHRLRYSHRGMSWFYRTFLRPALFAQESEDVHDRTLRALAWASRREVLCDALASFYAT